MYKQYLFLVFLCIFFGLLVSGWGYHNRKLTLQKNASVINQNMLFIDNKPHPQLIELFHLLLPDEITQLRKNQHSITIEELHLLAKKYWYTNHQKKIHSYEKNNEKVTLAFSLLQQLGFLEEISPKKRIYDYVFLFGTSIKKMQLQLNYVFDLWQNGMHFNNIIFLTSERSISHKTYAKLLTDKIDSPMLPYNGINILKKMLSSTQFSNGFNDIKTTYVVAQQPSLTQLTSLWLKQSPRPGTILALTHQPYSFYQHMILSSLIPQEFMLETAALKSHTKIPLTIYLHTIAQILARKYRKTNFKKNC